MHSFHQPSPLCSAWPGMAGHGLIWYVCSTDEGFLALHPKGITQTCPALKVGCLLLAPKQEI